MTRPPHRIALLNPNTNTATTTLMTGIAQALCPPKVEVQGHTMMLGPSIITNEAALDAAAKQVVTVGVGLASAGADALIVSAFGDPGLMELRDRVDIPVVGIAEAGMAEASEGGRRFSIITTTPDLDASIRSKVALYGHDDHLASLRISEGDAFAVMSDEARMSAALISIAQQCETDGAEALLLGGGPLARAAKAVDNAIPLPIIEPVSAGLRQALVALGLSTPFLEKRSEMSLS
ncbi:aspartate/glutamate racemase family protein [Celeribacter halophilus]|jgi:Asp/Glu/hydantoin racemase|uniref:aspartate/glutamate racemase family protein n=1 Tax=Celeribacter halophilus TaxID=576117 RepID=UPI003A95389E